MHPPYETLRMILKTYTTLFGGETVHGTFPLQEGAKIIAANHTIASDAFHLPLVLDEKVYFLMQEDLFDLPVVGKLLKLAGQIPVQRNSTHSCDCLAPAYDALAKGRTVVIFPEGELVPPGRRVRAKTGVMHMVLDTGVPVIHLGMYVHPHHRMKVSIHKGGCLRTSFWQFRGKCHLNFGTPWKPSVLNRAPSHLHTLTGELMDRIYGLVTEMQKEFTCVSPISLNPILR